jgi:hypothetical protein
MNEFELKRVQNDLEVLRQAVGLAPPALTIAQVRGFLWLAFTGLLLIVIALFPGLIPHRLGGWLVLACWIALPVRGLTRRLLGKSAPDFEKSQNALPRHYSLTVVVFGVVFSLWARALGLPWPITMGMLFFIEALPLLMVSVSETWRRPGIGLALTLITCGLGVPFVHGDRFSVLLGTAIFAGCSLSAGILYWQLCRHESHTSAN